MPISPSDQLKIVCFLGKMYDDESFVSGIHKYEASQGETKTAEATLKRRRHDWFVDGAKPQGPNFLQLMDALEHNGWPKDLPSPDKLLEEKVSLPAFLERCQLRYSTVSTILSKESLEEWKTRHYGLHFMEKLNDRAREKRARVLLPAMVGAYRLYRRHSELPGILREHFIINARRDGYCEGKYFQYVRAKPSGNVIPFNVFYCDFYVIAFGANTSISGRTEILTVSVIVQNAFPQGNTQLDHDERYFVGMLSGIYDYGNVLLSERVLVERRKETIEELSKSAGSFIPQQIRHSDEFEYKKAADVIDNTLDGQTLAVRPHRREWVLGDEPD